MGAHGESPRKILAAEYQSTFWDITWSPAGNRIAYTYARNRGDYTEFSVESCDLSGGHRTTIVQDNKLPRLPGFRRDVSSTRKARKGGRPSRITYGN